MYILIIKIRFGFAYGTLNDHVVRGEVNFNIKNNNFKNIL